MVIISLISILYLFFFDKYVQMRLQHIFETVQEDRAIVSLAIAIGSMINQRYAADWVKNPITLGKIGDLFNTSLIAAEDINLVLINDDDLHDVAVDQQLTTKESSDRYRAIWVPDNNTIYLNSNLKGTSGIAKAAAHELRHALDTFKSDGWSDIPGKYSSPRKTKSIKPIIDRGDAKLIYNARRDEINARFLEALHELTAIIHQRVRTQEPDVYEKIMQDFEDILVRENILQIFPEKTNSADYKRLIKRASEYVRLEIDYARKKYSQNQIKYENN
jgi:hypothetical protein